MTYAKFPSPLTLSGKLVDLVPLLARHIPDLYKTSEGQAIWQWFPRDLSSFELFQTYLVEALRDAGTGLELPFVIVEKSTNQIVGSTRLFNASWENHRVEVGHTWLTPSKRRRGYNRESKGLLFDYAFEILRMRRVELKADSRNDQSIKAMTGLGLIREGTLRSHITTPSGFQRDSVYFSVIDSDWPTLKPKLLNTNIE